jgi:RND family efflux transporter MFP subunit
VALVAGALLSAVAAGALRDRETAIRARPAAAEPLTVATTTLRLDAGYPRTRHYLGRVEPARRAEVGFEIAGALARIRVDEGHTVREGEPLGSLDTARLEARRRELVAALEMARAERTLAEATRSRIHDLAHRGHASRQQLDEADEGLRAARASVALADARIDSVETDLGKSVLRAPFDARVVGASNVRATIVAESLLEVETVLP